jgi:hypothetical protein
MPTVVTSAKGQVVIPRKERDKFRGASSHRAFGIWKDRHDVRDAKAAVDRLRKSRFRPAT